MNTNNLTENKTTAIAESKLYNLFKSFCGFDEMRPAMMNPFIKNETVYATDAHLAIMVEKKDCDFIPENSYQDMAPAVEKVIPEPNISKIINLKQSDFDKFKNEDEYEYAGKDVQCKTCGGGGEVQWSFEHWEKYFDCPKCDGCGLEEEVQKRKTGNKTFGFDLVKLGGAYFEMKKFYKLLKVQKVVGGNIELIHQSTPNSGHLFKIGICKVLVMPTFISGDVDPENILEVA